MTERSVVLTEEQHTFVSAMVESGFYTDANEVIRVALLKLEQEDESKLTALRVAIEEGFTSGIFEGDAFASVRQEFDLPPRMRE